MFIDAVGPQRAPANGLAALSVVIPNSTSSSSSNSDVRHAPIDDGAGIRVLSPPARGAAQPAPHPSDAGARAAGALVYRGPRSLPCGPAAQEHHSRSSAQRDGIVRVLQRADSRHLHVLSPSRASGGIATCLSRSTPMWRAKCQWSTATASARSRAHVRVHQRGDRATSLSRASRRRCIAGTLSPAAASAAANCSAMRVRAVIDCVREMSHQGTYFMICHRPATSAWPATRSRGLTRRAIRPLRGATCAGPWAILGGAGLEPLWPGASPHVPNCLCSLISTVAGWWSPAPRPASGGRSRSSSLGMARGLRWSAASARQPRKDRGRTRRRAAPHHRTRFDATRCHCAGDPAVAPGHRCVAAACATPPARCRTRPLASNTVEAMRAQFDVNLFAGLELARASAAAMMAPGRRQPAVHFVGLWPRRYARPNRLLRRTKVRWPLLRCARSR